MYTLLTVRSGSGVPVGITCQVFPSSQPKRAVRYQMFGGPRCHTIGRMVPIQSCGPIWSEQEIWMKWALFLQIFVQPFSLTLHLLAFCLYQWTMGLVSD